MRKFFPVFLILLSLALPASEDSTRRFLRSYYAGDYASAHELIDQIFSGTWRQQVWDERIHLQADLPGCALRARSTHPARGVALIRIGDFEGAGACFAEDWLSEFGRAMLAELKNRPADSREALQRALQLSPDNPDLLYFAAGAATTREMTLDLYRRFLDLPHPDPYRKAVAEFSMEFIQKTWNIPLNVPVDIEGLERIDSSYRKGELIIRGTINKTEKVSLLLDTGAGGITLREKDWQPQLTSDVMMIGIGKKQTSRSTRLVLNLFEAGNYQLKNPVAGMASGMPLNGADGIVGTSLFSRHFMLLPLRPGSNFTLFTCKDSDPITCLESTGMSFKEQITIPFHTVNRLILLKGRIRNSPENLDILLDTGAANCIISTAAAKRYARINYEEASRNSGISGVGGRAEGLLIAENVEIEVGGITKGFNRMAALNLGESSEAMDLELDLILGRDFLQGYTLLIDYANRRVSFLK